MNRPRLLALDLDGTLLCARRSFLPLGHENTIHRIQHHFNVDVCLVTGRPLLTARPIWQRLRLHTPLVCFNGAWVGYPDERCIAQTSICASDVREIIQALKQFPGSISAYPNMHTWCMNKSCQVTEHWPRIYHVDIQIDEAPFVDWKTPSPKILFGCDPSIIDQVMQTMRQQFQQRFHMVKSQADRFEIQMPVHKATGLAALCQHLDINAEDCWVAGDAANDIEMMQWAGRAFAMGHAPQAVLDQADVILPSINARGLCALIPHLEHMHAT